MASSEPVQPVAVVRARPDVPHEVKFISYPKLLFIWPMILMGLIFWPLAPHSDPTTLGWIYLCVSLLVILTLGVDVDRNQAVFWLVLIALVWVLALWLKDGKNILILTPIYDFFVSLNVRYDRGLGLAFSIVLAVPFVLMIVWAWINDRWRITHNEFEHYSFGRLDVALGRGAKSVRTEYPDVFEMLLGLAGTLIVYNATGQQELRRIPHVMFLPWVRARLDKVLERTAITQITGASEDEEG